jgi:hypothetical protein
MAVREAALTWAAPYLVGDLYPAAKPSPLTR